MWKPDICIYHGHCDDGFGAAFAIWKAFSGRDITFFPGIYGEDPPDVTGLDIAIVDFSYKRPVLVGMAEKAKSILVRRRLEQARAQPVMTEVRQ